MSITSRRNVLVQLLSCLCVAFSTALADGSQPLAEVISKLADQEQPVTLVQVRELAGRYAEDPDTVLESYATLLYRNKLDDEAFGFVLDEVWAVRHGKRAAPQFEKFIEDAFYGAAGGAARGGRPERLERWAEGMIADAGAQRRQDVADLMDELRNRIKGHGVVRDTFSLMNEQGELTPEQIEALQEQCDPEKWYPRTTGMVRGVYADALDTTYRRNRDNEAMRELIREKLLYLGREPELMSRSRGSFRRALVGCARIHDPEVSDLLARELEYEEGLIEQNPGYRGQEYEEYLESRHRHLEWLEGAIETQARGEQAYQAAERIRKLTRRGALRAADAERIAEMAYEDYGRPAATELVQEAIAECFERATAHPDTPGDTRTIVYEWAKKHATVGPVREMPLVVLGDKSVEELPGLLEALARSLRKAPKRDRASADAAEESAQRRKRSSLPSMEEVKELTCLYGANFGDARVNDLVHRAVIAGLAEELSAVERKTRFADERSPDARRARELEGFLARWLAEVTRKPPDLLRFAPSPYETMAAEQPARLLGDFLREQGERQPDPRVKAAIDRALKNMDRSAPHKKSGGFRISGPQPKGTLVLLARTKTEREDRPSTE